MLNHPFTTTVFQPKTKESKKKKVALFEATPTSWPFHTFGKDTESHQHFPVPSNTCT